MTEQFPVYAKGGFDVRNQEPIGFASTISEAAELVRAKTNDLYGTANNGKWINERHGVERLQDANGQYFVAKRRMREI